MNRRTKRPEGPPINRRSNINDVNHVELSVSESSERKERTKEKKESTSKSTFKSTSKSSTSSIGDFYLKETLKFWRHHTHSTGYSADELYASNEDGTITKVWIPTPWWDIDGYYRVIEFCFININHLIPDMKRRIIQAASELKFFDTRRVSAWNIFFICKTHEKVRTQFYQGGYMYILRDDGNTLRHTLNFMVKALESTHRILQAKKSFLKPGATEVLTISEEFLAMLDKSRRREIKMINEAKHEKERREIFNAEAVI